MPWTNAQQPSAMVSRAAWGRLGRDACGEHAVSRVAGVQQIRMGAGARRSEHQAKQSRVGKREADIGHGLGHQSVTVGRRTIGLREHIPKAGEAMRGHGGQERFLVRKMAIGRHGGYAGRTRHGAQGNGIGSGIRQQRECCGDEALRQLAARNHSC